MSTTILGSLFLTYCFGMTKIDRLLLSLISHSQRDRLALASRMPVLTRNSAISLKCSGRMLNRASCSDQLNEDDEVKIAFMAFHQIKETNIKKTAQYRIVDSTVGLALQVHRRSKGQG